LQKRNYPVTLLEANLNFCSGSGKGMNLNGILNIQVSQRPKDVAALLGIGLQFTLNPDSAQFLYPVL
jgi:hypothetical protein